MCTDMCMHMCIDMCMGACIGHIGMDTCIGHTCKVMMSSGYTPLYPAISMHMSVRMSTRMSKHTAIWSLSSGRCVRVVSCRVGVCGADTQHLVRLSEDEGVGKVDMGIADHDHLLINVIIIVKC